MFCTQPFNHIDIVIENNKVMLQPCNVWSTKKFSINEYKDNVEDLKNTLAQSYHYPGCRVCWNEDKNNIRYYKPTTVPNIPKKETDVFVYPLYEVISNSIPKLIT